MVFCYARELHLDFLRCRLLVCLAIALEIGRESSASCKLGDLNCLVEIGQR